jgi:hypothetical protein
MNAARTAVTTLFVVSALLSSGKRTVDAVFESKERACSWARSLAEDLGGVKVTGVHGERAVEIARLSDLIAFNSQDEAQAETKAALEIELDRVFNRA